MSLALLQSAMLLPLELAINQVLALDAASGKRLAALDGNTLAVQVRQPAFTLYVQIYGGKLHLSPRSELAATTTLTGSATALLGLLRGDVLANLQAHHVELRGDLRFAQQLQALLLDLHIDWEFHLSRIVGDIPTQAMADRVRGAANYASQTARRLGDDVRDFVLEEGRLLPSNAELDAFYGGIAALSLRVDRAAARIALLESGTSDAA